LLQSEGRAILGQSHQSMRIRQDLTDMPYNLYAVNWTGLRMCWATRIMRASHI